MGSGRNTIVQSAAIAVAVADETQAPAKFVTLVAPGAPAARAGMYSSCCARHKTQ